VHPLKQSHSAHFTKVATVLSMASASTMPEYDIYIIEILGLLDYTIKAGNRGVHAVYYTPEI
jgi:hypothetical protein